MAIDTATKRFSILNFGGNPFVLFPIPDGTFSSGDNLHLLDLYGGIASEIFVPPPEPVIPGHHYPKPGRRRILSDDKKPTENWISPKQYVLNKRIPLMPEKKEPVIAYSHEWNQKIKNRG